MTAARPYEIVVWGATGSVGKLVCEHVAQNYQGRVKWAIAGRNQAKLESVRKHVAELNPACKDLPIILGDAQDQSSLDKLAAQSKVVIATAGPFARYGTPIVDACVRSGADYCDVTGEVIWMRRILDKYHEAAKEKDVRIVHCCGFDSIPSDLGTCLVVDHLNSLGKKAAAVSMLFGKLSGAAGGGTIETILNQVATEPFRDQRAAADPYSLNPPSTRHAGKSGDQLLPRYNKDQGCWTAPFFMSSVNTRIVRRSAALQKSAYGEDFTYNEACKPGGLVSAVAVSVATILGGAAVLIPPLRFLLRKVVPKPGSGPSKEVQERGFWSATVSARSLAPAGQQPTIVKAYIADPGRDPGHWSTSRMLLEAALCLSQQKEEGKLMGLQQSGVLTPASAMGMLLVDRLRKAEFKFDIVSG
ncbi:TPA: hypothetical protein ACH3X2_008602 [Trebouxia sp. C0005]